MGPEKKALMAQFFRGLSRGTPSQALGPIVVNAPLPDNTSLKVTNRQRYKTSADSSGESPASQCHTPVSCRGLSRGNVVNAERAGAKPRKAKLAKEKRAAKRPPAPAYEKPGGKEERAASRKRKHGGQSRGKDELGLSFLERAAVTPHTLQGYMARFLALMCFAVALALPHKI